MSMPIASLPLYSASVRGSSVASLIVATWPRRMSCPLRSATTRLSNSCGILETAAQPNRALVERTVHATHRRREILRLQRLHDLRDADVRRLQLVRIDLDGQLALDLAEDLHVGHAGESRAARA